MRRQQPDNSKLDAETRALYRDGQFDDLKCGHCGGWHLRACPRVKRMRFRYQGAQQSLYEIEFWKDGEWDETQVIWPEDVWEEEEE